MTDEENNTAGAYLKLHEDVKTLILTTVMTELRTHPYGDLAMLLRTTTTQELDQQLNHRMQNYRVTLRGTTASY